MNKKNLKRIGIIIIMLVVLAGICWGIKLYIREKDPRWQAAKEIYLVQTALQKVDENAKLESLSEVRSFEITSPNSPTIYYYCTITSYLAEEPEETTALNQTALSMVVDIDTLENRRDCKVGNQDAVMGEIDGFHYLCWTYSAKYSCVFKYVEGSVTEEDLFHMAEAWRQSSNPAGNSCKVKYNTGFTCITMHSNRKTSLI